MIFIRVLIVDDHPFVRGGLRALLSAEPDMQVVGEAASGDEAIHQVGITRPDVILMDLLMPGKDGVEAMADIRRGYPDARFVVLTSMAEPELMRLALNAGAQGYVLKQSPPDETIQVIRAVHSGRVRLDPEIGSQILRDAEAARVYDRPPLEPLTEREHEVLKLLAHGLTNDEIGSRLSISTRTAATHVGNILGKLGLRNRAQALLYALHHGEVGLFALETKSVGERSTLSLLKGRP